MKAAYTCNKQGFHRDIVASAAIQRLARVIAREREEKIADERDFTLKGNGYSAENRPTR